MLDIYSITKSSMKWGGKNFRHGFILERVKPPFKDITNECHKELLNMHQEI